MELSIASASEQISVPSRVPIRKGDRVARFQAHIRPGISASAVRLRVESEGDSIETYLEEPRAKAPSLLVARRQIASPGSTLQFHVLAGDELPYSLSAIDLPSDATFDAMTGAFTWVPTAAD
jgi:hypothetical protein